jgi:hypothetical protein
MRTTKMISVLVVFALAGCHIGHTGADIPVASQPGGAHVVLRTASGVYNGELLAVQDDGVVISNDRIMFAPFTSLALLTVDRMGRQFRLSKAEVPSGDQLALFRAVSRFPQGLSPAIRSQLLAQKSQAEIVVIQ